MSPGISRDSYFRCRVFPVLLDSMIVCYCGEDSDDFSDYEDSGDSSGDDGDHNDGDDYNDHDDDEEDGQNVAV